MNSTKLWHLIVLIAAIYISLKPLQAQKIDYSFNIQTGGPVNGFAVYPSKNGGFFALGGFDRYDGQYIGNFVKIDSTKNIASAQFGSIYFNNGASGIHEDHDGNIFLAGTLSGQTANGIVKLNSEGYLDGNFSFSMSEIRIISLRGMSDDNLIIFGYSDSLGYRFFKVSPDGMVSKTSEQIEINSVNYELDDADNLYVFVSTYGPNTNSRFIKLNPDLTTNDSFTSPQTTPSNASVRLKKASNGMIYLSGQFSEVNGFKTSNIARINTDGIIDETFSVEEGNTSADEILVSPVADGKIIVTGHMTSFSGLAGNAFLLDSNGTVEKSLFSVNSDYVGMVRMLPGGNSIVSGSFNRVGNFNNYGVLQLNSDYKVVEEIVYPFSNISTKLDAFEPLPNGQDILIGGTYEDYIGDGRNFLSIDHQGNINNSFNWTSGHVQFLYGAKVVENSIWQFCSCTNTSTLGFARAITDLEGNVIEIKSIDPNAVSIPQGKIEVKNGYVYTKSIATLNEYNSQGIMRFTSDGIADPNFISMLPTGSQVNSFYVMDDNSILISGYFHFPEGTRYLAKLNEDGSVNSIPDFSAVKAPPIDIDVDEVGNILISGMAVSYEGSTKKGIILFNADGTLDATFNVGTGVTRGSASVARFLPDGRILVVGTMRIYNDHDVNNLLILNRDGTIAEQGDIDFANPTTNNVKTSPSGNIYITNGVFRKHSEKYASSVLKISLPITGSMGNFNGSINQDGQIILNWESVDGLSYADYFLIERSESSQGENSIASGPLSLTSNAYIDSTAQEASDYYFVLKGSNGPYTVSSIPLLISTPVNKVTGVSLGKLGSDVAELEWDEIDNTEYYVVEVSNDDFQSVSVFDSIVDTSVTISGLTPEANYKAQVSRVRNGKQSDPSDQISFTPSVLASTRTMDILETFIYPNPTGSSSELYISSDRGLNAIFIYSLNGTKVKEKHFSREKNIQIDISSLPPGLYLLRADNTFHRFIKD